MLWFLRSHAPWCLMMKCTLLLLSLMTVTVAGCGADVVVEVPQDSAISGLGRVFGEFIAINRVPPSNETEFRDFLNGLPESRLDSMGWKDWNTAQISPRDNLPFQFCYGSQFGNIQYSENSIVAHEQKGADGIIMAVDEYGTVYSIEIEEAKLILPVN